MFNPNGDDAGNEWVAIYNNGTDGADLSGWRISNRDGEEDAILPSITLPEDSLLYINFGQGYDDLDFAGFCDPPLTTVQQPFRELGRHVIEALVNVIYGKPQTSELIPPRLVIRETA